VGRAQSNITGVHVVDYNCGCPHSHIFREFSGTQIYESRYSCPHPLIFFLEFSSTHTCESFRGPMHILISQVMLVLNYRFLSHVVVVLTHVFSVSFLAHIFMSHVIVIFTHIFMSHVVVVLTHIFCVSI